MSWTCKLTKAELDTTGSNANINMTYTLTNDQTGEVQTRLVPSNGMSANQLKGAADSFITTLNNRDASWPAIQAAAETPGGFILSQG